MEPVEGQGRIVEGGVVVLLLLDLQLEGFQPGLGGVAPKGGQLGEGEGERFRGGRGRSRGGGGEKRPDGVCGCLREAGSDTRGGAIEGAGQRRARREIIRREGLDAVGHDQLLGQGIPPVGGADGGGGHAHQLLDAGGKGAVVRRAQAAVGGAEDQAIAGRQNAVQKPLAVLGAGIAVEAFRAMGEQVPGGPAGGARKGAVLQPEDGEDPAGQAVQLVEAAKQDLAAHRGAKARGVVELGLEPVEEGADIDFRGRRHVGQFAEEAAQGGGMIVVHRGVQQVVHGRGEAFGPRGGGGGLAPGVQVAGELGEPAEEFQQVGIVMGQIARQRMHEGAGGVLGGGRRAQPRAREVTIQGGPPGAGRIPGRAVGGIEPVGEARVADGLGELGEHRGLSGQIQPVLDGGEIQEIDEITGGMASEGQTQEREQGDGNRIGLAGGNGGQAHRQRVRVGPQDGLGERRVGVKVGDGHHHVFREEAGQFGEGPEQFVAEHLQLAARTVAAMDAEAGIRGLNAREQAGGCVRARGCGGRPLPADVGLQAVEQRHVRRKIGLAPIGDRPLGVVLRERFQQEERADGLLAERREERVGVAFVRRVGTGVGETGFQPVPARDVTEITERRQEQMEFDGLALVREHGEGADEQGIEAVRADDEQRGDGFRRGGGGGAELMEQAGRVGRGLGPAGETAPELTLPGLVGEGGGGEILTIKFPRRLVGVPAGRPIRAIPGVAVKLLGEELREGEPVPGREGGGGVETEVEGDLIHLRQELPAQALGGPEGMGPGKVSPDAARGEVPLEERARLEELEAHAETEFPGELDLQPVAQLRRRQQHGDGARNARARRQGRLARRGEPGAQGGEEVVVPGGKVELEAHARGKGGRTARRRVRRGRSGAPAAGRATIGADSFMAHSLPTRVGQRRTYPRLGRIIPGIGREGEGRPATHRRGAVLSGCARTAISANRLATGGRSTSFGGDETSPQRRWWLEVDRAAARI